MADDVRSTIQKRDEKGVVRHGGEWLAIWSDPNSLRSQADKREQSARLQATRSLEASLAATARSMAGRNIDVCFGKDEQPTRNAIHVPRLEDDARNLETVRGICDASASFLAHHDPDLQHELAPKDPLEARLFLLLEQLRCEALEARMFPGVGRNLVALQHARLEAAQLMHAHLASLLPAAEALRMVCRDSFLGTTEPSIQTAGFRMWDRWLRERFQPQLDAMTTALADQRLFGVASVRFLADFLAELPKAGERHRRQINHPSDQLDGDDHERRESDDISDAPLFEPGELEADVSAPSALVHLDADQPKATYSAFTTRHDRIVSSAELASSEELRVARIKLDEKMSGYRQEVLRLVGRLQRRILSLQARRWEFDLDEGLIDGSKLDRLVINPGFENLYKQEFDSPYRDTAVTLLVDNSGSMRGRQVETACVVVDLISAALERCSISTEILGFTTSAWKGGNAQKDWLRAGKPREPGRLNDLLHIIYKDASTPLRRARDSICAMLMPALLKENIDGEALEWAAGRLMQRPERRKILIVLSDGAPVDQSTLERNEDKTLLDRHLLETIGQIEALERIELCAIGIGHDVSKYYPVSQQVDRVEGLADAVVQLLDDLLIGKTLRRL